MLIRTVKAKDIPEIASVEGRVFDGSLWSEKVIRGHFTLGGSGFVAEAGGKVIGFVLYRIRLGKPVLIYDLAVLDDRRNRGYGKRLINAVCRGEERVRAYVPEQFLNAQLFFQRLGFRAVRVRKGFFDGGADAYVMDWTARPKSVAAIDCQEGRK